MSPRRIQQRRTKGWTDGRVQLDLNPAVGPKLYISGPMTGLSDFNRAVFNHLATELRSRGLQVKNPAEIKDGGIPQTWSWYMRRALAMMLECDAVLLLPGWEDSKGARIEHQIATCLDMDVYPSDDHPWVS